MPFLGVLRTILTRNVKNTKNIFVVSVKCLTFAVLKKTELWQEFVK